MKSEIAASHSDIYRHPLSKSESTVASGDPDGNICGIDIGGANLKYATAAGLAHAEPFAMWRDFDKLAEQLRKNLAHLLENPQRAILGITMTAELADCFATRRQGVAFLLDQVSKACAEATVYVYAVGGIWKSPYQAKQDPWSVAASNWFGLAEWVAKLLSVEAARPGTALAGSLSPQTTPSSGLMSARRGILVDIGSTTVDIVPFANGQVLTEAQTDRQRLQAQQLLYTGIERTPIAAILSAVKVEGQNCPLISERFVDSHDVYLLLGEVAEQEDNYDTADGRSRTRENAAARLARMVGEDLETLSLETVNSIAQQVAAKQVEQIVAGVSRNLQQVTAGKAGDRLCPLIFSGHGHFLSQAIVNRFPDSSVVSLHLRELLGETLSRCAPAFAVAKLLQAHLDEASRG